MSDRSTPETDQFKVKFKTVCGEKYWVPVDIARKLERERDEAIELLKYSSKYSTTKSQQDTYKFLRKIGKLEGAK